ncbi:MAG: hypothetical protein JO257_34410 [Deltaproteobacteria bacterium]|nr:hypothetical protein [Deltaproteobacteria bacterium]
MRRLLLCCALLGGCGSTSLKRQGEACSASSECAGGLLCDLAMKPAVCAGKSSLDAPPVMMIDARKLDAKPIDARPIDAPAVGSDAPAD